MTEPLIRPITCFICNSLARPKGIPERIDKHHVLFEKKRKYDGNGSYHHYNSSWKGALTIPLCRYCHTIYHEMYSEPFGKLGSVILRINKETGIFLPNFINIDRKQNDLQDAIAASFLVNLVCKNLRNSDYEDACMDLGVLTGDLYYELMMKLPEVLDYVVDTTLQSHKDAKERHRHSNLPELCLQFLREDQNRSEESIIKRVKERKKYEEIDTLSIKRTLEFLCDSGKIVKMEKINDPTAYYKISTKP
jgi:hypothetical protein